MQRNRRDSANPGSLVVTAAALLALSACSSTPKLDARENWKADGGGHYTHVSSGRVINEAQYTEALALEVRNRIGARMALAPNTCPTPKK
jgi:hypothetical protein